MSQEKIASFDVFDTLLTRASGSPESAFLLLGRRLHQQGLISCSASSFRHQRAQAEQRCFANCGGLDSRLSLTDIYRELSCGLELDIEQCVQQEVAFERDLLQVIPAGVRRLQSARDAGHRIVFASDMYLDQQVIADLLCEHGLMQSGDTLFVSSSEAKSKSTGTLYRHICEELATPPENIDHLGNSPWSDVKMANKAGWNAKPFYQGNANRYEESLDKHGASTDGLASAVAGASRLARLSVHASKPREQTIIDVAAGAGAPLLIGFVLWALNQARSAQIKRLYFIARDGQLLSQIARILVDKLDLDLQIRYLYGSRQAWQLPSFDQIGAMEVNALLPRQVAGEEPEPMTTRQLLGRFELTPTQTKDALRAIGIAHDDWDSDLSESNRERLRDLLIQNADLQEQLEQNRLDARAKMTGYLMQEGFADPGRTAIVDLGTGGTLFNAISNVLEANGTAIPAAYYLGQREVKSTTGNYRTPERYLFDARTGMGIFDPAVVTFAEAICSADHGSVLAYKHSTDKIDAILAFDTNHRVIDWGLPLVSQTIVEVAKKLRLEPDLVDARADLRQAAISSLQLLWQRPTRMEAQVWGDFPLDDGWGENPRWLSLATPYRLSSLLRSGGPHRHWWHEAAVARSNVVLRALFSLRSRIASGRPARLAKTWRARGDSKSPPITHATTSAKTTQQTEQTRKIVSSQTGDQSAPLKEQKLSTIESK